MDFVPDIPRIDPSQLITYFSDDMMGLNEYYKWPQMWSVEELHSIAASAHPLLFGKMKFCCDVLRDILGVDVC